jgi:hypothetical protein
MMDKWKGWVKNIGEKWAEDKDTKGNNFLSLLFNDNLSIKII